MWSRATGGSRRPPPRRFSDGWLHTGDWPAWTMEGFVYIVDRAKDMLIRGGENVYCVEIESVLYEHPAVADAAVIGIPHPVLGEEVGAVVQLRPGFAADRGRPPGARGRPAGRVQGAGTGLVRQRGLCLATRPGRS